ncbi:MAG: hypothetical protein IJ120_12665 [Solobacterium sp.]|nr:hypothetical protein [Solobacterium sp.]
MVKVVRKKKKSFRLVSFTAVVFGFSVLMYLASALFLRTINNSISSKVQTIQSETAKIEVQNNAVKVEIQTLSAKDRVDNIADENGLRMDQDNIVTITAVSSGD